MPDARRPSHHLRLSDFLATVSASAANASQSKEAFESGGILRVVHLYAPDSAQSDRKAPLLVLFHGSGRDGISQIREWKSLAEREGVLLAAPDSLTRDGWVIPGDGPQMIGDLITFLEKRYAVDRRRIYAFGHSAGAVFALRLAVLQSKLFAAAAVHAGAFRSPGDAGILPFVRRPVPILIAVGVKDRFFSVESVRATAKAFEEVGIQVEVHEIKGHDHDYYRRSGEINRMAWEFLSARPQEEEGSYIPYVIETTPSGMISIAPANP